MPKQGLNADTLPSKVADAIGTLGRNIEIARKRRRLTQDELASRVGLTRFTLRRIEQGNPTTAIGAYFAALWALGLEAEIHELAAPTRDAEGQALELARQPSRVRTQGGLDDDF